MVEWLKKADFRWKSAKIGMKKAFKKILESLMAEDTRFELVRLLHQHAFQACAIDH